MGAALLLAIVFLPEGLCRSSSGARPPEMAAILDAQGLNKCFGAVTAAQGVTAAIERDSWSA